MMPMDPEGGAARRRPWVAAVAAAACVAVATGGYWAHSLGRIRGVRDG